MSSAIEGWQLRFLLFLNNRPIFMARFSIDFSYCGVDAPQSGHLGQSLSIKKECGTVVFCHHARLRHQHEPVSGFWRKFFHLLETPAGESFEALTEATPDLRILRIQLGYLFVLLQCGMVALERQKTLAQHQSSFAIIGLTSNDHLERLHRLTWLLQRQVGRA